MGGEIGHGRQYSQKPYMPISASEPYVATYMHTGMYLVRGDKVRVLGMDGDMVKVYPLKWDRKGVPYAFRKRDCLGMPFMRVLQDKLVSSCMFDIHNPDRAGRV